jgi:hypothetical protein
MIYFRVGHIFHVKSDRGVYFSDEIRGGIIFPDGFRGGVRIMKDHPTISAGRSQIFWGVTDFLQKSSTEF